MANTLRTEYRDSSEMNFLDYVLRSSRIVHSGMVIELLSATYANEGVGKFFNVNVGSTQCKTVTP